MGEEIVFQPVIEPEPGDEGIEILYAISSTTPSGSGGSLLLDGSVMIGFDSMEVLAFPALDHFLECESLLWAVRDRHPANPSQPDLSRMALRPLPFATGTGLAVEWLSNGSDLVYINRIWYEVFGHRLPTVRSWTLDAPLRSEVAEHLVSLG